ncbi:unnamed protein product [Leptosia nina]|uniref:Uncharacterized protein n=1 Tax=Leptosia nina TaxID=320188 RepID=A0AAV1K5C9_9NEOP
MKGFFAGADQAGGEIALFACRSLNLRKCPSKKPTEQDFVSTLPNLDALRDDKGDAASMPDHKSAVEGITARPNKNTCSTISEKYIAAYLLDPRRRGVHDKSPPRARRENATVASGAPVLRNVDNDIRRINRMNYNTFSALKGQNDPLRLFKHTNKSKSHAHCS